MLNAVCRYFIARAVDSDLPVPRWVRRRVDRSPELRAFRDAVSAGDRSMRATPALDEPPFLASRIRARLSTIGTPEVSVPMWRRFAPIMVACALLGGAFVTARLVLRPGPEPSRRSLGELWARMPAPEDVVRRLESQGRDEARQLWNETRATIELVVARMPSPPSLKRSPNSP